MTNDKKPSQLPFAQFAEGVRPSGAVNRIPVAPPASDVYTYSVYLNGPLAKQLPKHAQEHTLKDVTLQALTEKLSLNPLSARDNLKVAELVALRGAWMSAVLESSFGLTPNSPEVDKDFALLSEGMKHPWITAELDKQRELSSKLGPSLARAGVAKDLIPKEVSVGIVVAQDENFTLQQTKDGEVVTHENRRLQELPRLGADVMVTYYRGYGQVVNDLSKVKFSNPFIDPTTEDLAVQLMPANDGAPRTVLFNNVQSYEKFVKEHGLDASLVQAALDAREANPKTAVLPPARTLLIPPYIDEPSGCLAVDYEELGMTYTALFDSAEKMGELSAEFGLGAKAIAEAFKLEAHMKETLQAGLAQSRLENDFKQSELDIRRDLTAAGYAFPEKSGAVDRQYFGPVVAVTSMHVAQDIGRRKVVIHDARALDKLPAVGDKLNVHFKDGRGIVADMVKSGKDLGR